MPSQRRHERASPSSTDGPAPGSLWALAWSKARGLSTLTTLEQVERAYTDGQTRLWIDLDTPDEESLGALAKVLGLHPLVAEDILERNQRAKVELTENALHIVMFALAYQGEITKHELDIVLGPRFLLTSHDGDLDLRNAPFVRRVPTVHLDEGVDYALWLVADWLVDDYFPVFDHLGEEIDQLEDDVMRRPSSWIVERLFTVRRDLVTIRHAVNPQREIFNQLTNRDLRLIDTKRVVYFRDVYDHLIRLTDELDSYRELVGTALDIYLTQVNNNLSEIMKRLTGVTVVLTTIAAVGGIFGMSEAGAAFNFTESIGFWAVTIASIVLAGIVFTYFRRKSWI